MLQLLTLSMGHTIGQAEYAMIHMNDAVHAPQITRQAGVAGWVLRSYDDMVTGFKFGHDICVDTE
tara:strand:- start:163 stop:357 length:195 start_codon:yes stop_codon:yes gene_type:complete